MKSGGRGERQDPTAESDGKPTRRPARQVVEMNIVRGRGIRRKNVAERKNDGRVRAALESMRMSGGSETLGGMESERTKGQGRRGRSPRENEKDEEKERNPRVREGGK